MEVDVLGFLRGYAAEEAEGGSAVDGAGIGVLEDVEHELAFGVAADEGVEQESFEGAQVEGAVCGSLVVVYERRAGHFVGGVFLQHGAEFAQGLLVLALGEVEVAEETAVAGLVGIGHDERGDLAVGVFGLVLEEEKLRLAQAYLLALSLALLEGVEQEHCTVEAGGAGVEVEKLVEGFFALRVAEAHGFVLFDGFVVAAAVEVLAGEFGGIPVVAGREAAGPLEAGKPEGVEAQGEVEGGQRALHFGSAGVDAGAVAEHFEGIGQAVGSLEAQGFEVEIVETGLLPLVGACAGEGEEQGKEEEVEAFHRGGYSFPVCPKPPSPRSVLSRRSVSSHSALS